MRALRFLTLPLFLLAALGRADTLVVETKADWQSGTLTAVDLDTYGWPALYPSLTLTATTNQAILVDSFENTTVSKNTLWTTTFNFPNYVTQVAGVLPIHGSKMLDTRQNGGAMAFATTAVTRTAALSAWFRDNAFGDATPSNNISFGSGYAGDLVSFLASGNSSNLWFYANSGGLIPLYIPYT